MMLSTKDIAMSADMQHAQVIRKAVAMINTLIARSRDLNIEGWSQELYAPGECVTSKVGTLKELFLNSALAAKLISDPMFSHEQRLAVKRRLQILDNRHIRAMRNTSHNQINIR